MTLTSGPWDRQIDDFDPILNRHLHLAYQLGMVKLMPHIQNVKNKSYKDTSGPGLDFIKSVLTKFQCKADIQSKRNYAILRLLFDLGLRASELTSIDVEDFNYEKSTLAVIGKGWREKQNLNLPDVTREAVSVWINQLGRRIGPLFISLSVAHSNNRLTRHGLFNLIKSLDSSNKFKVHPHSIRHTAITEACRQAQLNGFGIEEVLRFSRHASLATLLVYRDNLRDAQGELAKMISGSVGSKLSK